MVAELLQGYRTVNKEYILFFVVTDGKIIGHIGLDNFSFQRNECVVESLIMEQPVPKGLAAKTAEVLYAWAKETLKIKRIYNNVVGSNAKIRLLASAQGFKEIYRLPLYKKETEEGVVFHPMYMPGHETPDEFFVFAARDL